jgi:CRP-like cAMP-binding protein
LHESLIKYIKNYSTTPLTKSEEALIINTFIPKKIRKKQYFLQEGEVCKYSAFIVKGAMRLFSVDDKGIEHIVQLSIENWWACDRESFSMLTPSLYNIDAWEDTEVLIFTMADLTNLINQVPAIAEMIRQLDLKNSISTQKRVTASISFSAEKRYNEFMKTHPQFLQRFPLHIIASYLGITKETLSRIRKQV